MKNTRYHIYLDLDGVFANFEKRLVEFTKAEPWSLSSKDMWTAINYYDRFIQPFFSTLEKMPECDRLWSFVTENFESYSFLSAKGTGQDNYAEQKAQWVSENICTSTLVECVERGAEKYVKAAPHHVLVDDMERNIDAWVHAGGIGILHRSVDDTLEQLSKLLART